MQAILNKLTNPMRSFAAGTWIAQLAVLAICLCAAGANAQKAPIVVTGTPIQLGALTGGGWDGSQEPIGGTFVVGVNGDVLIGDGYSSNFLQITPSGTDTVLAAGVGASNAALDSYGNLYFGGNYNANVYKIPYNAATGAYVGFTTAPTANCLGGNQDTAPCIFAPAVSAFLNTLGGQGFAGVAFDGQGNFLFETNTLPKTNPNAIFECNLACIASSSATPTLIYADTTSVGAFAIDPWDNIFFVDGNNSGGKVTNLNEIPLSSGSYATSPTVLLSYTNAAGYSNGISGLAIAGNGTVYFSTNGDGIFAFPNTKSGGPSVEDIYMLSTQGGKGVALDSKGNLYGVPYNGGDVVSFIPVGIVPLGASPVGTPATAAKATVFDSAASCTTPPTLTLAVTEFGKSTTEFTAAAGASCSTAFGGGSGVFSSGPLTAAGFSSFPVTANFTPIAVGERNAALTISDAANSASGTAALSGVGQGALANLDPGVATAYASGFTKPYSVSVDVAGDLVVADAGGFVYWIPAGSPAGTAPISIGSGFGEPSATAFDANGNLYIADFKNNDIVEIPNVAGVLAPASQSIAVASTVTFDGTALNKPSGLGIGPDGVLYISDLGNSRVVSYNPYTGANGVWLTGLTDPWGVAVDASNNLYVAVTGSGYVLEDSAGVETTLTPTGVTAPWGVAVDASGSLVISDKATGNIVWLPNDSTATPPGLTVSETVLIEKNPTSALGIALDIAGDLYTTDSTGAAVYAIQRTAAFFNFGSVQDGVSSDTGTIYAEVTGNMPVTLGTPAFTAPTSTDFSLASTGSNDKCTSGGTGQPGQNCQLQTVFTPAAGTAAGPVSATATLSSNALNGSSDTITLTGTASLSSILPQTITNFNPPATANIGQQITLSATGGASGNPVVFSIDPSSPCSTCATITGTTLTASAAGSVIVDANQAAGTAGGNAYGAAPEVKATIAIASATPAGVPGMVMSQQSWLPALTGGGAFAQDSAAGSTFGVNANGDVLLSDSYGGSVLEYTPSTGAFTTLGGYGKYNNTGGVTLDSAGNLYVSALYSGIVVKVPYANGVYAALTDATSSGATVPPNCTGADTAECVVAPVSTVSGIAGISAMTFDSSGDLFLVTDDQGTPWSIWECTAACLSTGTPAPAKIFQEPAGNNSSTTVGQLYVGSLAADPWGNLFFTDSYLVNQSNNKSQSNYSDLYELPYTSGTGFATTPVLLQTFTNTTPGGYDDEIDGVAVTSNGTVYYASQYDGIVAIPNTQTGGPSVADQYLISGQGAKEMTLDANGNIYYVSYHSTGDTLGMILTDNNLTVPIAQLDGAATSATATVVDNAAGCTVPATLTITSSNAEFSATAGTTCSSLGFGDGTLTNPLSTSASSSYSATISFSANSGGPQTGTLTLVDSTNGGTGTATVNGVGQETPQTITFTAPTTTTFTYGVAPITLAATGGGSNNPITFTVDKSSTATGSISGNTLTVTGAGNLVIDANQAGGLVGGIYYSAAPQAQLTLTISPEGQTITFTPPASPVTFVNGLTITLNATTTSGGTVVFSVDASSTGAGTIAGNVLTVTIVGNLVIDANVAASTDYVAATQVQQTIVVTQGTQAITFAPPTSPVNFLTGLTISLVATGGGSGNPVSFTVDPSSTGTGTISATTVTGTISTATLTVTSQGTLVIDANQASSTNFLAAPQVSQSVTVNAALPTQTITFNNPGTQVVGTPLTLTATASSGLPVSFSTTTTTVCTVASSSSGWTATFAATGTCTITASQAGNAAFAAAALVMQSFTVNPTGSSNAPAISMSFSLPSLTIEPGTVGLTTLTVKSVNNFAGQITFACSNLPSGYSCTFNPSTITVAQGSSATTTLSVGGSASAALVRHGSRPLFPVATFAVALCLLGFKKRNRLQLLLFLVIGIAGLGALSGCGGTTTTTITPTTTKVTVTATASGLSGASGSVQQTATFTIISE